MDNAKLEELRKALKRKKGKRVEFVEKYITDRNGADAVVRAGITENRASAAVIARRYLLEPDVRAYVDALDEAAVDMAQINKNNLLLKSEKIYRRCMQEEEVFDREGNPTGMFVFDSRGAIKAVERQAKMIGVDSEMHEIKGGGFTVNIGLDDGND